MIQAMRRIGLVVMAGVAVSAVLLMLRPDLGREGFQRVARLLPDDIRRAISPAPDPLADRLAGRGFALGQPAFIRIFKQEARLEVWLRANGSFQLYQSYPICRFSGQLGPKQKEGDRQAPEGFYAVSKKQLNPNSRHHLSFNLGYPNAFDRAHGRTGSYLMVHGGCSSVGCYAMTDGAIDDIYRIVEAALDKGKAPIPVHIFPFRMTRERLAAAADEQWIGFWKNLKAGYDLFAQTGEPPMAYACGRRYGFRASGGCRSIAGW